MPEETPLDAVLAALEHGPALPAPLQRAAVAALAWLDALDREAEAPTRSESPPRDRR
jgi:hypothetical protein